jgi:pyridoxine/pyridoxamine 5'-phosphate oxidase
MAAAGINAELVQAAEAFTVAAKSFNGEPSAQMKLLKQADELRLMLETPLDTVMRQWELVSGLAIST